MFAPWAILGMVISCAIAEHQVPSTSITMDPATKLIIFGTRHGNRNPEVFLEQNPRSWGQEGSGELTSFGKRQAYGLGKAVREFVGDKVSRNFKPDEAKYFSSSANRCQMTLQAATAGIHTPEKWGDWKTDRFDDWSPVPYVIDDAMLRIYAVTKCKKNEEAWKEIDTDTMPHLAKIKEEKKELLDYMAKNTGWNMNSLGKAADVADNIIEIELFKEPLPQWISNPTLPGYTGETMRKAILEFAGIHKKACAEHKHCGQLMTCYWLSKILEELEEQNKDKSKLKLIGYASHIEITLPLMKLMGVAKDELASSAGFVIEYKPTPVPSVRLLNHDPNPIDEHVIYRAEYVPELQAKTDADGWVPLTDFDAFVRPKACKDWHHECGADECAR